MKKIHNINADLFKHTPTFIQKHVTNHEKILKKQSQIDPKILPKINRIRSLGRFRSVSAPFCAQVGSRTRPLVWRNRLLEPFWPKVTRQGTILGPPLDSKWLQNRTFEHRSALGPPNMTSGRGFGTKMENV